MAKHREAPITVDEIIATVKRSAYPTAIIEGKDDVVVMRRLEDTFSSSGLTIIPAGGRAAVLSVFERRSEMGASAKVAFIADKDLYVVLGIPQKYNHDDLVFTDGYSIENDMFRDGELHKLIPESDRVKFDQDVSNIAKWYCLSCQRIELGSNEKVDIHPNFFLDDHSKLLSAMTLKPNESFARNIHSEINGEYYKYLRGKSLFGILQRHIKGYSNISLLNIGAARNGILFKIISKRVGDILSIT